jgi:regulatory protein
VQRRRSRGPASGSGADRGSEDPIPTAIGLLARRAHSRLELRRKLSRRGFVADAIEAAMARLVELGYLDDRSFAQGLVRRRGALRGPLALSAELAARGVDRAQAEAAVAEFGPEAQLLSATRLAERLHARRPATSYRELLDGVGSKLLRRGFSAPVVRAACRAVLGAQSGGKEDASLISGAPGLADD